MKKTLLFIAILFTGILSAQSTITIGDGTSESATRGPLQRSSSSSSSVYSRAVLHYSATELSTTLTSSATISQINFELGSENIITAPSGDATIKIYMRNSTATDVIGDSSWTDAIDGATEVGTYTYNITNNFDSCFRYSLLPKCCCS